MLGTLASLDRTKLCTVEVLAFAARNLLYTSLVAKAVTRLVEELSSVLYMVVEVRQPGSLFTATSHSDFVNRLCCLCVTRGLKGSATRDLLMLP
jgi:hypothetical protein